VTVRFLLNGEQVEVISDPDTPLLLVLRDELGLVGAKFGCGLGQCGACAVRLGDAVVPSCSTPLWQAEGAAVGTVEGLAAEGLHPVQQAIVDLQAAQCGFCTAGIVVRAAHLLEQNPHPTASEVAIALDGHLCRCGIQRRVIDAVVRAGETAPA
jgi:nicotinate dehydrogenase subunit A